MAKAPDATILAKLFIIALEELNSYFQGAEY